MKAISIVFPHGTNIALEKKTLEVCSWLPIQAMTSGWNQDIIHGN